MITRINSNIRQRSTSRPDTTALTLCINTLMKPTSRLVLCYALFGLAVLCAGLVFTNRGSAADLGTIVVQVDKPGARIGPNFYGLMTEEVNYSYDGGPYGELIQNRLFNDPPRGARGAHTN
jgi:hypothetical protein